MPEKVILSQKNQCLRIKNFEKNLDLVLDLQSRDFPAITPYILVPIQVSKRRLGGDTAAATAV